MIYSLKKLTKPAINCNYVTLPMSVVIEEVDVHRYRFCVSVLKEKPMLYRVAEYVSLVRCKERMTSMAGIQHSNSPTYALIKKL